MRLNRFLAAAGLGSRRSCEELIRTGQVTINGAMCLELATQVEATDVVKVGNRVLHTAASMTILLHKPPGFICTAADEQDRRTVFDLLPANFPRLFHVGRLDKESEGLLVMTNDGELSLKLTHPRYKVEKEYEAVLDKPFDFGLTDRLVHGMMTPEGWAKAESVHRLGSNKVKLVLRQGLKRQIRQMFYQLGYEVDKLVRTRIGPITIEHIPAGHWRVLTQKEIQSLLDDGVKGAALAEKERAEKRDKPTSPRPPARKPTAGSMRHLAENSRRYGSVASSDAPPRSPSSGKPPSRSRAETEIPFKIRANRNEDANAFKPRGYQRAEERARPDAIPFTPRAKRTLKESEGPRKSASAGDANAKPRENASRGGGKPFTPRAEERPFRSRSSGAPAGKPVKKAFGTKPVVKSGHGFSKFMKRR